MDVYSVMVYAAMLGTLMSLAALFSEKVRSSLEPIGFGTIKRARIILVVSVLVFIGALQNLSEKEGADVAPTVETQGG